MGLLTADLELARDSYYADYAATAPRRAACGSLRCKAVTLRHLCAPEAPALPRRPALRMPALVLGMAYYRLKDLL